LNSGENYRVVYWDQMERANRLLQKLETKTNNEFDHHRLTPKEKLDHVAKYKNTPFIKNYLEGVFHMEMGENDKAFTCLHRNLTIDVPFSEESKNSYLLLINVCLGICSFRKKDLKTAETYLNGNFSGKIVAYVIYTLKTILLSV